MRAVRLAPAAASLLAGACAVTSVRSPQRDDHDVGYLAVRGKQDGCLAQASESCCRDLVTRLEGALANDDGAETAKAADAIAISCTSQRRVALDALERPLKAPADERSGAAIGITYVLDVRPTDRVYWASAIVDGRTPTSVRVPWGSHRLEIEFHVMAIDSDELITIRGEKEILVEPGRQPDVTVTLRRAAGRPSSAGGFTLDIGKRQLSAAPSAPRPPTPPPGHVPKIRKGRLKSFAPRMPTELRGRDARVFAKVCVRADGRVDSVTPIGGAHPRHLGALLDGYLRAEFEPYAVDDRPVPFCSHYNVNFQSPGP